MTALAPVVIEGNGETNKNLGVLAKVLEPQQPPANFHSVAVCNSTGVHFGNKTYIDHVTIKQVIHKEGDKQESNGPASDSEALPSRPWSWKGIKKLHQKWGISLGASVAGVTILCSVLLAVTIILVSSSNTSEETGNTNRGDGDSEGLQKNIPITTDIDKVLLVSKGLRFVSRQEWLAQPAEGPMDKLEHPVPIVIIAHTVTENCTDQSSCTFVVRFMQTYHIESRNWSDIAYNFMVGGDGGIYEGRGWDIAGSHTRSYNLNSIGLAFIGTFNNVLPNKRQLVAAQKLLELGVLQGKLAKDYRLYGHRQFVPFLSPGDALFNEIKKWPHFATKYEDIPEKKFDESKP